ncbi:MAG: C40 family peptidase [Myxococcales bacterium]|nr:C40 family peptidase [Myxococcales bacterium]
MTPAEITPAGRVAAAIAAVRGGALAEFGWTHVELVATDGGDGRVRLRGAVAARGLLERVRRACDGVAELDTAEVGVLTTGRFAAVPPAGMTLQRHASGPLATELDGGDGPVEVLAEHDGAVLVRAADGTVGWTRDPLGAAVDPPRLPARTEADLAALERAWPAWIDAPYRLGGTRPHGVDCSGLVQRLLGAAGLRMPRHSSDQLAVGPHPGVGRDAGDVVAIWSADEAPCHVGLVVAGDRVVQASRSRSRVVVEPIAEFVATARRVAHVPLRAVLALQRDAAGEHDLLAVLRGRPA